MADHCKLDEDTGGIICVETNESYDAGTEQRGKRKRKEAICSITAPTANSKVPPRSCNHDAQHSPTIEYRIDSG